MNAGGVTDRMTEAIAAALREDVGMGDVTTECTVPSDLPGTGVFVARANGVLSGLDAVETVLALVDPGIALERHVRDGMPVLRGQRIATARGSVASMLTAERTALNFLQRMSGIATMTAAFVKLVEGTGAAILDTRKTAPGLRAFDKRAVRDGRGTNHRFGLDDMVLVKDNHIAAAGGITDAVALVRARMPKDRPLRVEVETQSMAQLLEALSCDGIDVVMLDNFAIDEMATAVRMIRARRPGLRIEASGNVSESTVRDIAATGVDMISIGALTHSVRALDISLDIGIDQ
jgi:nicotinate-nucleotide pyrophosphorylase (carboxylating)